MSRLAIFAVLAIGAFSVLPPVAVQQETPPPAPAGQEQPAQPPPPQTTTVKPLAVRLRSFVVGTSGTLTFEPTLNGGLVRLTVLGLPSIQALLPEGKAYYVWAVGKGVRPLRMGQLQTDAGGNGGLEFPRPAPLDRYSVLVTAELNEKNLKPVGMVVLSTWLGEAKSYFGTLQRTANEALAARLAREKTRSARLHPGSTDFYEEVDDALRSSSGGRVIELFGDQVAPQAHGTARVTARNSQAYVRALVTGLPLPAAVGANVYILWAVQSGGRIVYMGSLPTTDQIDTDIYVRVAGFRLDDFGLFATAEKLRPAARPSDRRALSSQRPVATR